MPLLWSRGSCTYINFSELLWNYEFIITKFTFTENQTFLQNFYTTKIWSHTVAMMWLPALLVWAEYQPWQQLLLAITMATRQIPLTQVLANEYICKDQLFTLL